MPHERLAPGLIKIANKKYCLVEPTDGKIVDLKGGDVTLILTKIARKLKEENVVDFFIFEFGGWFYYTPINEVKLKDLTQLKYLGKYTWRSPVPEESRAYLGVHGKYELMCGIKDYKEWVAKASFLGYTTLGICEKETLAGAIQFTHACQKKGIQPIIGASFPIKAEGGHYNIKLYATSQLGWENLMAINSQSQIGVRHEVLLENLEGIITLIEPGENVNDYTIKSVSEKADATYFQFTTTKWGSEGEEDKKRANMRWFLKEYQGDVPGILSNDAYCPDKNQEHLQEILVTQGGGNVSTKNHSLKPYDHIVAEFQAYFEKEDIPLLKKVMHNSIAAFKYFKDNCNFTIEEGKRFLPKYEMTEEETRTYGTNEGLFKGLISKGLTRLIDFKKYDRAEIIERIKVEGALIKKGEVIDYFLILWDIIKWCKEQGIETGPGRGSSAGSLISYCLGITKINPLEYGLLFERFLDESRITTSLPDIDTDFASDRRDDVLQYMRDRYDFEQVCQVGTYGSLKLKSSIKELSRYHGLGTPEHINYMTKVFSEDDNKFIDIFKVAGRTSDPRLINFIREFYPAINDVQSLLGSLKNTSVHACATIIAPKNGKNIKRQIPIRVHPDGTLISEWEGGELDDAGYLKEDILSTSQMAKIGNIIRLVKEHYGEEIHTELIPLDDPGVYKMFCEGRTEDVFHFGSPGLTTYLSSVQPQELEDLIAANALYRPGTMISETHMEYVKLKNNEKDPEYDFGLEEVTKATYGLYVYQEQIMKAVQVLGGFTLAEANGVRKAMGKKIKEKMDEYGAQFISGAASKGCPREEAVAIWEKLQVFSSYGFNKSHAAAYSVIGYVCNWLKLHYPLEFWITAFEFGDEDKIPKYISEINKTTGIQVSPPDINSSTNHFTYDIEKKIIYWNLSSIKFVGDNAVKAIMMERESNGAFFSLKEFFDRMNDFDYSILKTKVKAVNKRTIVQLIVSGAFDKVCNVREDIYKRYTIMSTLYRDLLPAKEKIPAKYSGNASLNPFWAVEQYNACRLSTVDYKSVVSENEDFYGYMDDYLDGEAFNTATRKQPVLVIGLVDSVMIKNTKKGDPFATVRLVHNTDIINIRIWSGELENPKNDVRFQYAYYDGKNGEETLVQCNMRTMFEKFPGRMMIVRGNLETPDQWKNHNELVVNGRMGGPLVEFL